MKKLIILIFSLFVLQSCYERIEKTSDILSPQKMKTILLDLYINQEIKFKTGVKYEISLEEIDKNIFIKYNLTEKQFRKSHQYWSSQPLEYKKIYESLLDTIQFIKGKYVKEKMIQDQKRTVENSKGKRKPILKLKASDIKKGNQPKNQIKPSSLKLKKSESPITK